MSTKRQWGDRGVCDLCGAAITWRGRWNADAGTSGCATANRYHRCKETAAEIVERHNREGGPALLRELFPIGGKR